MTGKQLDCIPDTAKSTYAGRRHLGWLVPSGKSSFLAVLPDRTILGAYPTKLQARNALWIGEDVES